MTLAALAVLIVGAPLRHARSERAVTLGDLVGTYEADGRWLEIRANGASLDIFDVDPVHNIRTKILTTQTGLFERGDARVATQAGPLPYGFFIVQSTVAGATSPNPVGGSDFIYFSRVEGASGPLLKVAWRSVRFDKETLARSVVLNGLEMLTLRKQSSI
jgi:hypothetical protein